MASGDEEAYVESRLLVLGGTGRGGRPPPPDVGLVGFEPELDGPFNLPE